MIAISFIPDILAIIQSFYPVGSSLISVGRLASCGSVVQACWFNRGKGTDLVIALTIDTSLPNLHCRRQCWPQRQQDPILEY